MKPFHIIPKLVVTNQFGFQFTFIFIRKINCEKVSGSNKNIIYRHKQTDMSVDLWTDKCFHLITNFR